MCLACKIDGAFVTNALTWAIPVDVVKLGAHLDAYIELKPLLHQLRLCHRFGEGPDVHLTKLPQELLELVVDCLLTSAQCNAPYKKWDNPFSCFEGRCSPVEHVSDVQLENWRREVDQCLHADAPSFDNYDKEELEEAVQEYLDEMSLELDYYRICEGRKIRWKEMIAQKPSGIKLCECWEDETHEFDEYAKVGQVIHEYH
jgi:hypothetical protein